MFIPIIPKPNKFKFDEGTFELTEGIVIVCENNELSVLLHTYIKETTKIIPSDKGIKEIVLRLEDLNSSDEGYRLIIKDNCIVIISSSDNGLFYGIQSLRQLIMHYKTSIPCMIIEDKPRFSHRGFMLDVCRHFFDKEVVKRLIDLSALHKLNVFHLHLTEDQGWRSEIDKYPLLTELGSYRKDTIINGKSDNTPVSGYFTKNDLREIVSYAKERFIRVIPEFDMPGHIKSAIVAYPYLSCEEKKVEIANRAGITADIACAGKESTFEFIFDVIDELIEVFEGEYFHLGGDEAPKTKWYDCPHCQRRIKEEGLLNENELQGFFMNRVADYLEAKGKKAIVWNDAIRCGNVNEDVIMHHWLDGKQKENTLKAISSGRKTIMSDLSHTYLDYPHGMIPLNKTYSYDPIYEGISTENQGNILGVEAPLWTELVESSERIDFLVFPRLSSIAEVGWTDLENKDYSDYLVRLESLKSMYDLYDVKYAGNDEADIKGINAKIQVIKHIKKMISFKALIELIQVHKETKRRGKKTNHKLR